ncbi:UDP-N-acetylglucosamine 2-epimerase (non-hydrolyzing) [Oceanisphaera sediminis]|uniref:UDP-N-acetylglucosamine 2-epimerase (Non-hydrolyzing) n=1 Tax=Oceanisphaera sediminis TaxID=981381 RepID=A0ABP7E5N6_9GAMM
MKIVTILGARPQFIKAGSISRLISNKNSNGNIIEEVIIHTGQHYDDNMSDIFFEEMKIPKPDYNLGVGGRSHGSMTGQMIEKIENILLKELPDYVMVYGDTNSTLAGAIAASKLNIKIAHVEAGLRSFNMLMPEEVNRILTDRVSSLLFCPTIASIDNLNHEGIDKWNTGCKSILSGDVMKDGAIFYSELSVQPTSVNIKNDYILCTIHRAENTDDPLRIKNIIESIVELSNDYQIVLPLHPRTKKIIGSYFHNEKNVSIIDPVGYLNMIWLIKNCSFILTDSGGLQKEAFFFNKPCITMRDETEWVELIDEGVNILAGTDKKSILSSCERVDDMRSKITNSNIYGDGNSSDIILNTLLAG